MKDSGGLIMNKRLQLIAALMVFLAITGGVYVYTYCDSDIATMDIAVAGDDIANAEDAASQPDWDSILTPVEDTETLRPNATGNYTQCDPVGDVSNYLCVDEEVADDDATYVETSGGATELDTYSIPDHSEGIGTINSVAVYIRCGATTTADLHAAETVIQTHDTNYFSSNTTLPISYTDLSTTYETNPDTTNAWTWDEIDALETGVRMYDNNGGEVRCTQVYVDVIYEAPQLSGDVPTGDLFEITPDTDYTGDMVVRVYLTNTGALAKAYQYLNVNLYLEGSVEAGETPNYRVLTLENGWVTFKLRDYDPGTYTLSVTGGDYSLVSRDTSEWEEGWTVTPELYCQIVQRGE